MSLKNQRIIVVKNPVFFPDVFFYQIYYMYFVETIILKCIINIYSKSFKYNIKIKYNKK